MKTARIQGAQLHGHRPQRLPEVAGDVRFAIKAVVAGSVDARRANEFHTDVVLVDGTQPGSGQLIDWSLLSEIPDSVLVWGADIGKCHCRNSTSPPVEWMFAVGLNASQGAGSIKLRIYCYGTSRGSERRR